MRDINGYQHTLQKLLSPNMLVVHNGDMYNEQTGEITLDCFLASVVSRSLGGGYIVGTNLYGELGVVCQVLEGSSGWRLRSSIIPRIQHGIVGPRGKPAMRGDMRIDYITLRKPNCHKQVRDTVVKWVIFNVEAFTDDPPDTLLGMYELAQNHLTMLARRGVKFKGTRGSTAVALLRKSPFFVTTHTHLKRRLPAPQFINEEAREALPGNFYSVKHGHLGMPGMDHCYLIDQISAHHTIASTVPLPHPEHIHARGHHRNKDTGRPWIRVGSNAEKELLEHHLGLVYARIQTRHLPPKRAHLYPKWADKAGTKNVWLWTPELKLLQNDPKVRVLHYICALTATKCDEALSEYARWALQELAQSGKKYKKSTLLSVYGILAINSVIGSKLMYAWAGPEKVKGTPMHLPIIGDVTIRKIKTNPNIQSNFLNVAARGVIEAETRTRSITYARELEAQGITVAQIYADAVVVNTHQLPFIPKGWRVAHSLTNVIIPRSNGLIATELRKLPGMPREALERRLAARVPFSGVVPERSNFTI